MGPLKGIRIVEFAGIGPGPFAAMMLSDAGAEVLRVERPGARPPSPSDITFRGRSAIQLDLKQAEAVEAALRLVSQADALIEGFRPGVMERLGIGPDVCLKRNPRLVYGRMTGWGQSGPMSQAAGHDINYIALTGALHAIGRAGEKPVPPLNLVGDFGGGALYLVFGIVCALLEAQRSQRGQIVDAAMTDGASSLMTMFFGMASNNQWRDQRGVNLLDSGAHFYNTYETKDGKWIALGSIEPQFYKELIERAELPETDFSQQMDRARWPELQAQLATIIKTKTRDEWDVLMLGTDVCYAPVLSLAEAPSHPHSVARSTFVKLSGVVQPAPAPRFSRTVSEVQSPPQAANAPTALRDWGFSPEEIDRLRATAVI